VVKKLAIILVILCSLSWFSGPTMAHGGYYVIEDEKIEFYEAVKADDPFFGQDWPVREDINGDKFFISTELIISETDIKSIAVKYSPIFGDYNVFLTFNIDSWQKIRSITESIVGSHLAIIHDGTVLSCPLVHEPFYKEAVLVNLDMEDLAYLLGRLKKTEWPSQEQKMLQYIKWLRNKFKELIWVRDSVLHFYQR